MLCRNLLFKSGVTVETMEKYNFDQIIEPQTRKTKYIGCFLGVPRNILSRELTFSTNYGIIFL